MRVASKWLLGVVLPLLLLAAAWVACNGRWTDAAPQAVPPELRLRPVRLAPSRNAFYDLQGLNAPPSEDANAWGQLHMHNPPPGESLSWPTDVLWQCKPAENGCVQRWRDERARMTALLAAAQDLGRRCEVVAAAEGIEEIVIERPASGPLAQVAFAALPFPRYAGVSGCVRWFGVRAALAANPRAAMQELVKADHLARAALAGSRSLIGTMVGVAAVQRSWLLAADFMASTPGVERAALLPVLAPLPAQVLDPRIWVPSEARFVREVVRDTAQSTQGCEEDGSTGAAGDRLWCRLRLGLLPELSNQYSDARWLARLAAVPRDGLASCEQLSVPIWREPARGWPTWRNTLGRLMLDTETDWARYTARQLDLELLRLTLRAQVTGEALPAGVQLRRDADTQQFAGCQARLYPGEAAGTLRLPPL